MIINNHSVFNLFPLIDDEKVAHGIVVDEDLSFVCQSLASFIVILGPSDVIYYMICFTEHKSRMNSCFQLLTFCICWKIILRVNISRRWFAQFAVKFQLLLIPSCTCLCHCLQLSLGQ